MLNRSATILLATSVALSGCAPPWQNLRQVQGPAIADIITPMDAALGCLRGRIMPGLNFAVGAIPDLTGREQYNDGGAGRFVTQGAGDMVQSALFKAGVSLVNRRETAVTLMEAQWGIRNIQQQAPAHLLITGSINSLDFIPGGGAVATIGGIGPRYRQNRILIGLDLVMTNLQTGQIVGSIALHKQIYADEIGFTTARIQGGTVVDVDIGAMRREAVHNALRVMLQLATFELLTQAMPPEEYRDCRMLIDPGVGGVSGIRTTGEEDDRLTDDRPYEAGKFTRSHAAPTPPRPEVPE